MTRRAILALLAVIALATSCVVFRPLPKRHRELRGVWVATVNNGDWPSRKNLTAGQQKQELVAMFDRFAALHLNAVFLQIRPAADAFYPSPYETIMQDRGGINAVLARAIDRGGRRGGGGAMPVGR